MNTLTHTCTCITKLYIYIYMYMYIGGRGWSYCLLNLTLTPQGVCKIILKLEDLGRLWRLLPSVFLWMVQAYPGEGIFLSHSKNVLAPSLWDSHYHIPPLSKQLAFQSWVSTAGYSSRYLTHSYSFPISNRSTLERTSVSSSWTCWKGLKGVPNMHGCFISIQAASIYCKEKT